MIGPEKVYRLSCLNCDYRDDVICTKLDRILHALNYTTPSDCPYINHIKKDDTT